MEEIVGRLHPTFCFDLSRVFCQGATIPPLPGKVETFQQTGSARGKEIDIALTKLWPPGTKMGGAEKAPLKRGQKCAQVSVANFEL